VVRLNVPAGLDDSLVDGIRQRSDRAFATVYELVASDLFSFARGMLHDTGAAEDAVQQAFLELARAAPTIKGDGRSVRAWLYRSVRFSCLDEIRRRTRHPEQPTLNLPDHGVEDDDPLGDPSLQTALMRLGERHRTILVLRHVIGYSAEEIAEILGSNRTAVYAASARAERRLRLELDRVESRNDAASEQPGRRTDIRTRHEN
jgi:RNA polymerase sigma-70 factor (ECF subfamily)